MCFSQKVDQMYFSLYLFLVLPLIALCVTLFFCSYSNYASSSSLVYFPSLSHCVSLLIFHHWVHRIGIYGGLWGGGSVMEYIIVQLFMKALGKLNTIRFCIFAFSVWNKWAHFILSKKICLIPPISRNVVSQIC